MLGIVVRPTALALDLERGPVLRKALATLSVPALESDATLAECAQLLALPAIALLVVTNDALDADAVRAGGARAVPLDDGTLSTIGAAYAQAMLHLRAVLDVI